MVSQPMLRAHEGKKKDFSEKRILYVTALDLIKCIKQINSRGRSLRAHLILIYNLT